MRIAQSLLLLLVAVAAVAVEGRSVAKRDDAVGMQPLCPAAVCNSGAAACGGGYGGCGGGGACVAHLGRCSAACSSGGASVLGAPCFLQTGGGAVCELGECAIGSNARGYCAPADAHSPHRFACACRCPEDEVGALEDTPAPVTTAAPPVTTTTPGPTSAGGGGGLTNAEIVAIVMVSAGLGILLLLCIGWCCMRQTRKQARKSADNDADNMGVILQGTTVVTGRVGARAGGGGGATGLF